MKHLSHLYFRQAYIILTVKIVFFVFRVEDNAKSERKDVAKLNFKYKAEERSQYLEKVSPHVFISGCAANSLTNVQHSKTGWARIQTAQYRVQRTATQ